MRTQWSIQWIKKENDNVNIAAEQQVNAFRMTGSGVYTCDIACCRLVDGTGIKVFTRIKFSYSHPAAERYIIAGACDISLYLRQPGLR